MFCKVVRFLVIDILVLNFFIDIDWVVWLVMVCDVGKIVFLSFCDEIDVIICFLFDFVNSNILLIWFFSFFNWFVSLWVNCLLVFFGKFLCVKLEV